MIILNNSNNSFVTSSEIKKYLRDYDEYMMSLYFSLNERRFLQEMNIHNENIFNTLCNIPKIEVIVEDIEKCKVSEFTGYDSDIVPKKLRGNSNPDKLSNLYPDDDIWYISFEYITCFNVSPLYDPKKVGNINFYMLSSKYPDHIKLDEKYLFDTNIITIQKGGENDEIWNYQFHDIDNVGN